MTELHKLMIVVTCGCATGFMLLGFIMMWFEVPLPEGAELIREYENGWREFRLEGNRYLMYGKWYSFSGYAAITQIHDKPNELTGQWEERDGMLEFEKGVIR